ncbi:LOW QUALITY PROTEIN: HAUS augmin-like complex subunit 1 [Rana temporaria]|uniref:LOW QUALITY PROTEIN: HAUS augmin-like complex subunit 1 n=1 Tax=Rana temporaria TaxID=8407 RepID=UPI001AAE0182|nr:LOW QUALITY PROTEIN: HAUS augmin-like complex subunit 1 [Rana temporaria]
MQSVRGESSLPQQAGLIIAWLKKMFGDKALPPYEVNTRTVEILCQLAEWNEARDKDLTLVIEDQKMKTSEIKAEANYLQELLSDSLGPSYTNLSRMGNTYLNQLVDSCLALEIKDSSLTSYIPAVNDLSFKLVAIESNNQELDLELMNLRKKLTDALVLEKSLEQDLRKAEEQSSVEKAKVEVRAQNMKTLKDKSEEYKYKIQTAQDELSAAGMEDSLTHRSLVSLSEMLAELKTQSTATKEKLKSYLDLAPNPSLVKVKIEEAKRELKATEAELNMKVDMMEFVLPEQKRRIN